jgi:cytochrome bd-type quinol oxidase subunit 2
MRNTPVVLGVLSIAFGSLQALVSGASLATQSKTKDLLKGMGSAMSKLPGANQPGQPDFNATMDAAARLGEDLKPYTLLLGLSMVVMALALVAVGILLYKRRARARPAALAWAVAALLYIPCQLYLQVSIINPRTQQYLKEIASASTGAGTGADAAGAAMDVMSGMMGGIAIVGTVAFYAPFPIVLLALMGRSKIKQVLEPAPPAPAAG